MSDVRKQAERIARETGGDAQKIERCLRQSYNEPEEYSLMDAIADVLTFPVLGGTAVIRTITEINKKKK